MAMGKHPDFCCQVPLQLVDNNYCHDYSSIIGPECSNGVRYQPLGIVLMAFIWRSHFARSPPLSLSTPTRRRPAYTNVIECVKRNPHYPISLALSYGTLGWSKDPYGDMKHPPPPFTAKLLKIAIGAGEHSVLLGSGSIGGANSFSSEGYAGVVQEGMRQCTKECGIHTRDTTFYV